MTIKNILVAITSIMYSINIYATGALCVPSSVSLKPSISIKKELGRGIKRLGQVNHRVAAPERSHCPLKIESKAWDRANNPMKMGMGIENGQYVNRYKTKFSELPQKATLSSKPWTDTYWPTYQGGIAKRWNQDAGNDQDKTIGYTIDKMRDIKTNDVDRIKALSPAEKYDLFLGKSDFPLTNYERSRTQVLKTCKNRPEFNSEFEIPTWEGLCHAWAPASYNFKNPNPVTVTGAKGHKIEFGASDVKALLIYALHLDKGGENQFLGERCNDSFSEIYSKIRENMEKERSLIEQNLDQDLLYDIEDTLRRKLVRNGHRADSETYKKHFDYMYQHDIQIEVERIVREKIRERFNKIISQPDKEGVNPGAFHLVLANQIGNLNESFVADVTRDAEVWNHPVYGYNTITKKTNMGASPGAALGTVKEVDVSTQMRYIVEMHPAWDKIEYDEKSPAIRIKNYNYTLELDKNDNIIGGRWAKEGNENPFNPEDRPDFLWNQKSSQFSGYFRDLNTIYEKATMDDQIITR